MFDIHGMIKDKYVVLQIKFIKRYAIIDVYLHIFIRAINELAILILSKELLQLVLVGYIVA